MTKGFNFASFNRALLATTFSEVKKILPQARANDVGACSTGGGFWTAEVNRPCYGAHFHWSGRADNAWHAKQQLWAAWLRKNSG